MGKVNLKSKKIKRAAAVPVYVPGKFDPTVERVAKDDFKVIDAPRLVGEIVGRDALKTARKQVSRVCRMQSEGWVSRAEAAALERYEEMLEVAGYGGGRSCLDMSPRGGGGPEGVVDALAGARRLLAMAQNAVTGPDGAGQVPLIFVNAVLSPYGAETMTDVIDRMLGGPRADRRESARRYCSFVGGALAGYFKIGRG